MARINRTRFAVLGMLSLGEQSGYDLKRDIEQRMRHFWAESAGQIYPTLKALQKEGLVLARHDLGTGKRKRTLYRLTPAGQKQLREWLREPPIQEQVRNEILLKFYFGPELGTEGALGHLDKFEADQRALLGLLESFKPVIAALARDQEQRVFWQITLNAGICKTRARIHWCSTSRAELKNLRRAKRSSMARRKTS